MIRTFPRPVRLLCLLLLALAACTPPIEPPEASAFRVGATRSELLSTFGKPAQEQTFHKSGNGIWGPIEDFWSRVPMGSKVEVWSYPVQGGMLELYFIDDSAIVQGTGFAPAGAVFESNG